MNQNRITEDRLDTILEMVRTEQPGDPLLQHDELIAHLRQVDAGELMSDGGRNRNLRPYLVPIIMTTIISVVIGLALLLAGSEDSVVESAPQRADRSTLSHGTPPAPSTPQVRPSPPQTVPQARIPATGTGINANLNDEKGEEEMTETENELISPALFLEDLSPEELERGFGIYVEGGTYLIGRVREVRLEDLSHRERVQMAEEGIDTSRPVIYLESTYGYAPEGGKGDRELSEESQIDRHPATELMAITFPDQYHRRSFSEQFRTSYGWDPAWALEGAFEWRNAYDDGTSLPSSDSIAVPSLIGVRLPSPSHRVDEAYILWYVPTPELIDLLPERYQERATQVIPEALRRGRRLSEAYVAARREQKETATDAPAISVGMISMTSSGRPYSPDYQPETANNIPGVRYIDLTIEEGEGLGIGQTDTVITGHMRTHVSGRRWSSALEYYGYPTDADAPVVDFLCGVWSSLAVTYGIIDWRPTPVRLEEARYDIPPPLLYTAHIPATEEQSSFSLIVLPEDPPASTAVNDTLFRKLDSVLDARVRRSSRKLVDGEGENRTIVGILDRMVPVRVYLDNDSTSMSAVFWYLPTDEFIERLPERYRDEIRREVELVTSAISNETELCDRIAGDRSFLGLCRERSGALLGTGISPNPAKVGGTVDIEFTLREDRKLRITLHDFSGRFIGELQPFTTYTTGLHSIPTSLKGVGAGAYLISVESDEGDRGVQRVVVSS